MQKYPAMQRVAEILVAVIGLCGLLSAFGCGPDRTLVRSAKDTSNGTKRGDAEDDEAGARGKGDSMEERDDVAAGTDAGDAGGDDSSEPDSGSDATDTSGGLDLPDWADHRLTVAVDDSEDAQRADYNLVVSGRIEATGETDETFNESRYGVGTSSVWPDNADVYYYSGRLLSVKLRPSIVEEGVWDYRNSTVSVTVDGERINHESYDPSEGDLAYGFMGYGNLPADMRVERSDCDHEVRNRSDLVSRLEGADDGETICAIGEIHLPEGPGTGIRIEADDLRFVGFPASDGTKPRLYQRREGDWGYGNVALQFTGDRVLVQDLEVVGPGFDDYPAGEGIPPGREANHEIRGIEFEGSSNSFVVNVDVHHFSHANISARGEALTVLCVDTHHPWPSGRSYGVATGGPLGPWREDDPWTERELAEGYTRWHNRTEIRRVLMDGGRHDAEGGTHGTYSLDQFVIGEDGVGGGRVDMHRPGGGVWRISGGAIEEHDRGGAGVWMRGWPEIGWRVRNVWFSWGTRPDPNAKSPTGSAPLQQVNSTQRTRSRRKIWASGTPFVHLGLRGNRFGEGHPREIDPELGYYYEHFEAFLGEPSQVYEPDP